MKTKEFNTSVENITDNMKKTLMSKAIEYANETDRLHNFKTIAQFVGITPAQVAIVLLLKNFTSLKDKIFDGSELKEDFVNEKLGDTLCYLTLLNSVISDSKKDSSEPENLYKELK